MVRFPALIGSPLVGLFEDIGRILILLGRSIVWLIRPSLSLP